MKKSVFQGITILFASFFAISCIILPVNGASTWTIQTVDSDGDVGVGSSIVFDNLGRPWISYSDITVSPDNHLKVAHFTGTTWEKSIVDPAGDTATVIALDKTGNPAIAYQDSVTPAMKYAKLVGNTWTISVVDAACQTSSGISLVFDSGNVAHIAYIDRTDPWSPILKYATPSGPSSWSFETVTTDCSGSDSAMASIQVDSAGTPYISYYNTASNSLVIAHKVGALNWPEQTIVSGDAEYPSLKLNSAGNPCVCYFMITGLYYAYFDGSSWHSERVDPSVQLDYFTSLVLDVAGYPHISYYDSARNDLKYAYYDGSVWQVETVDATGVVGPYASLALDSSGYPYIAYRDSTLGTLKCAFIRLTPTPESDGAVILLLSVGAAVGCYIGIKRRAK